MYKLMANVNGEEKQLGTYETYETAFFAGMDGDGYCQFWIVEEEVEK